MKYNYIFFTAGTHRNYDSANFYTIAASDLRKLDNVHVVDFPLDYASRFRRTLYSFCFSKRVNKIIPLASRRFWYPQYFKNPFEGSSRPLCFVCLSPVYANLEYVSYLKKRYPEARFAKIFQDKIRIYLSYNPSDTPEKIRDAFDVVFSLSKDECLKYGFTYSDDFISKIVGQNQVDRPSCDVFFAGKAKDRLPLLLRVYDKLTADGVKCDFYITNAGKDAVARPNIVYSDSFLPYPEMIRRSINCKCMLDVNQMNFDSYTIRFNEAIIYNKKLLINNDAVKESKYYNPDFIQIFHDAKEIDSGFVKKDCHVDYHYCGDFSPIKVIERIDEMLP
jgi:hypothetical protein